MSGKKGMALTTYKALIKSLLVVTLLYIALDSTSRIFTKLSSGIPFATLKQDYDLTKGANR